MFLQKFSHVFLKMLLMKEIFASADWPRLDSGEVTEEVLLEKAKKNLPEHLHGAAEHLIMAWDQPIEPVEGMADLVKECKERGWGVYLLSNASFRQKEYWPQIPGSEYFDGTVVSACEGCMKPDVRIYEILLDRFHLNPADCWFIDDVPANIAGAERAGIRGILFDGQAATVRERIFDCLL